MKNVIKAIVLVLGFSSVGTALAGSPNVTFSSTQTGTKIAAGTAASQCPLLANDVTLNVSNNVVGAVAWDETNNWIRVAACHQGGSRETGVKCSTDADPSTTSWDAPAGCTTNTGNSSIPSFHAYGASSAGGTIGEYVMDQRCTSTQISGITLWN